VRPVVGRHARIATLLIAAVALTACAPSLQRGEYQASYSMPAPAADTVWQDIAAATGALQPDWFVPIDTGPEALRMRLALIDSATESIDAKYFIWHEDHTGSLLLERVLQAADRGVRVRLLIDDVEISGAALAWRAADAHPNIEIRLYNPFLARSDSALGRYLKNLNQFARVNHRMHNKALIVDGQVAMIGGRNVADEYHGFGEDANFRDFDVLVGGDVLAALEVGYDTFWNSGWAVPVTDAAGEPPGDSALLDMRAGLDQRLARVQPWLEQHHAGPHDWRADLLAVVATAVPGQARALYDRAEVDAPVGAEQVASEIAKAAYKTRDNLLLVTPYLVPTDRMLDGLTALHERGVRLTVLTNSMATNNHLPVHAAYANHRGDLLDRDVELYEFRIDAAAREIYEAPGFTAERFTLHAKVLLRDDRWVFVGTFNLDPRSIVQNTELGLEIDSPALARRIREYIQKDLVPQNAWRVDRNDKGELEWVAGTERVSSEPGTTGWQRLKSWLLGLAPFESQL
ncbi:MAG TPA: phospholipase D family protein, partial [Steroidobacteraceae bacterium]|nr:phospholipase D family protein [Steroidobacteraceae bacterium]